MVNYVIADLDPFKACGPDGILVVVLTIFEAEPFTYILASLGICV